MACQPSLVGPPEVYRPRTATPTPAATGNPFVDQMVANFNKKTTVPPPPMIFTENYARTFLSTGNPCLDFFFHVVPNTPPVTLTQRLQSAWDHNPLTALKLVCNLRGVRGTGKSDKEGYYTAALWLHKHHPKTLACNVGPLAEFGYFKDLPEILYRILEGPEVRRQAKMAWMARKSSGGRRMKRGRRGLKMKQSMRKSTPFKRSTPFKSPSTREARVLAAMKRMEIEEVKARESREEKKVAAAKKAIERYNRDPDYKFLYDRISDLFADILKSDIQHFNSNQLNKISLAAKWCPSLDSSFDKATLLCESVAKRVYPCNLYEEYDGVSDAHYAYRVRDRLRKEILVPLRKALELPEVYIGANQWGSIPYNRVASVAMKFYKEKFRKHDKERFEEYLEKVKSGKATIAAGALLPHDIIASLNDMDGGEVAELQWKRMVDDLSKKGKLKNCLAICDVSGSMSGVPMEVSVALGVLVSELSEEPWKGKLITFSQKPTLQMVLGGDLRSKTDFVRTMDWGMNTDFQKVFDLILEVAVNAKLTEEQMIKRVFVFSDMEFDQASARPWETDYQAIVRKFGEKGYGSSVPEIVFWNLRDSRATPVPGNQKGVALVSGFSKNLMTVFLEESGALNPESVMEVAIAGEEYKKLVVLD
ncbi:uncharacterized protein LOC131311226 [Rhododendron vialii]|uniref:uncharacterized protein LOC131311226 n=1 Tax=Rhododendron vialii TaxID=182163 RepID=UPI00265D892E|nr:uncharacterized protein LOC131311226 [Rhododendron vialii]